MGTGDDPGAGFSWGITARHKAGLMAVSKLDTNEDKCHPPPLPVIWGTGGGSRGNISKIRGSLGDGIEGCLPWGATRWEKPLSKNCLT